jgi:hypothetical protein
VDFRHEELIMLSNALNEVLHGPDAIEAWEFETRMGASREDAEGLRSRLSDEIRYTN